MSKSELLVQAAQPALGQILVEEGVITESMALDIAAYQRQKGTSFGRAAVLLKHATDSDIRHALSRQFNFAYLKSRTQGNIGDELVTAFDPFSRAAERFKQIRSQLLLQWFNEGHQERVIAVVGAGRGEGRSYVAANLAVVFSQLGKRTLLIDGDLRVPRLHTMFDLPSHRGLSLLLSERAQDDCVSEVADLPGLFVLPAGPQPPNPLELLCSTNCDAVMATAADRFDVVIVDTPASSFGGDSAMLGARTGAALLVAQSKRTKAVAMQRLTSQLRFAGVRMLGAVLNDPAR